MKIEQVSRYESLIDLSQLHRCVSVCKEAIIAITDITVCGKNVWVYYEDKKQLNGCIEDAKT